MIGVAAANLEPVEVTTLQDDAHRSREVLAVTWTMLAVNVGIIGHTVTRPASVSVLVHRAIDLFRETTQPGNRGDYFLGHSTL